MYADVVFPLNLKPLTYRVPQELLKEDLNGYIVSAPIKNKESFGLVVKTHENSTESKKYKAISNTFTRFADKALISLILWASDYYLHSEGVSLSSTPFKEFVSHIIKKKHNTIKAPISKEISVEPNIHSNLEIDDIVLKRLTNEISKKEYQTFFLRLNSIFDEVKFVTEIIKLNLKSVLILVPENYHLNILHNILQRTLGERLEIITSKMKTREKGRAVNNVLEGRSDIVLGTRSAILTPLNNLSLIIVVSEHSPSYKAEEGLRYNARDLAVMRGYLSNCPVILTSYAPSVETYYNFKTGKYTEILISKDKKCKSNVIQLKTNFTRKLTSPIPPEILKFSQDILNRNGIFAIFAQSEGHSFLYCKECGKIIKCKLCNTPMIVYNTTKTLLCNKCNYNIKLPDTCLYCGGIDLQSFGVGLDRIKEEIKKNIKNLKCHEIDIDLLKSIFITRGIRIEQYNLDGVAILDFDFLLLKYGFRSNERVFQDIMRLKGMIKEEGTLLIETAGYNPDLLKAIKNNDFEFFYNNEIIQRLKAGFPPFTKIISINIYAEETTLSELVLELKNIKIDPKIEMIIGDILKTEKKGSDHYLKIVLRGKEKRYLNEITMVITKLCNQRKGVLISIDVDPYMI